ncbi:hypothetical protein [Curtobacterium sp. MCSS17_005]|uniref:hypothetical protein n=1 Tax=Curtobacterium sp. MCSS17_005 TaxID=2175641 RepID=UPI0011B3BDF5|nr:hypothetical protein [Curtobacterium sp. MCSS17_005]WIB31427.1 hypothetical protein DEJ20_10365 [Curtobacterium sp. MCSS17_005]
MNNRQAALIAATSRGTNDQGLDLQVRIFEFWLDEQERAHEARKHPRSIGWVTSAIEAVQDLERTAGEPMTELRSKENDPVAVLAGGDTYQFTQGRWWSRGPLG